MSRLSPFWVVLRGARYLVRAADGDEPGNQTLVLPDRALPIDRPADLLAAAEPGEAITADYGVFTLTLRRGDDGRPLYRAASQGIAGPEDRDEEAACWGLLARLGDEQAPRACMFCRWSEVEPSTGWGNLGCAVAHAEAYHRVATPPDARTRKWGPSGMLVPVDEWHACDRFEVRPIGYGYRGRAARAPGDGDA